MDTGDDNEPLLRGKRGQDLQGRLREVGLAVEFWLPKLQEHLGVTCAQALQHLEEEDLQKLKSLTQHSWEKKALERLLNQSHSNSLSQLQECQVKTIQKKQKQAEETLQELEELLSEGRQRQEEAVRKKEEELRQALEIPKEYWPPPEKSLQEVTENLQKQLNHTEGTLSHRKNLPDGELVRYASGGLALQGIYKTSDKGSLIEKREELLSVPKEFSLCGPQQGTQMKTIEFTSSQAESMFTQTIEKLGFSATALAKGGGWGLSLKAGMDQKKDSESEERRQSHSKHSYFCSTKFNYIPLASCHFAVDQLQFSKAALQELKCIEDLLGQPTDSDRLPLLRRRTEEFFQRFGSHANQGPFHLGGIYWWKAISEGFQSEQLEAVKQQTAEALDIYITGSYTGFGVKGAAGVNVSQSHSKIASQSSSLQNLQTKVQLSVVQTGGPPEANGLLQWKTGLVANNQTWCVIDRGNQLVPIWDIILSSNRSDFKDPFQVANCLKQSYTALTGLTAQIQEGEELLNAEKTATVFLDNVKSWEVSDPEEQLKKLIHFMQMLTQKIKSYDFWIHRCLTDWGLQNFLINTVNFCKKSSIYGTEFIKSQLRSLLDPHIYRVSNFPQADSIMQWIFQSEPEQEHVNITKFSELIKILEKNKNDLMEGKAKSESTESVEEAQVKATYEVSVSLGCFLNYLRETGQQDTHILLLSIATGAGYHGVNNTFQYLLGCDELDFLLNKMQSAKGKYKELKNICDYRAHAFLVLTGLTATAGIKAVSPEEKTQRLALVRHHMAQSLSKEVVQLLSKPGADHNWENLEKDLRSLIDGDYGDTISSLQRDEVRKQLQSLFYEKKQSHKSHDNENNKHKVTENQTFLELLQRLNLEHYYPKKMSTANFHQIYKKSVHNTQPCSERELPFYFLQKLLMLDYGLRYLIIKDGGYTEKQVYPSTSNQENDTFDPYEDLFEDNDSLTNSSAPNVTPYIHPMDIQMAILYCADVLSRQYILAKLSICQFALPLLIPNPCNSQIEFSLWSLSQIRRSWQQARKSTKEQKDNYKNQQMCRVSTPIVSFLRIGNDFSASKSQIMNCLLTKRKHDVFFHRHCKGSSRNSLLMGGVVEVAWFCPGGEDEDRFDNCLTFTNLHGDAKEHKKQLTFLLEVSSLIVVLMSTSDDNKENRKIIHDLCQASKPLICLLDDKEKLMANTSGLRVKIGIRNRNEAELIEELTITIRWLLELSDTTLSLEDCAQVARKQGLLIDEDQRDCKEAKEKAEVLMALLEEVKISQMKENLLPLQGKLWQLWCKKDKELYHLREKGNRTIEQHKSEIEMEKQLIRQEQLNRAFPLNSLIHSVLEILQNHSETHTKLYFLQWLSVFLDKLTAGHLEKLNEKKKALWSLVQKEKQEAPKSKSLKAWQSEIEAISREISDCSLGTEQILREVGQIYEALEEASSTLGEAFIDSLLLSLPHIAADLMISGVPIELMDGDASYVPLKWVAAVFDQVSEKLGNKRLFVLSILGLQSSGKSTLLNALFGLQFTVSAGRCTRGAYMQLLKVEETFTEELGFDFMLVVDTEGLRAPELSNKSQNRDNELATFVIGLGNLTLINIFGENPSEMQDILQIVVQAFLRMKQVKISPSCLFVHQNVGEVTAKDQTMEGRRWLEQRLDEMAATAAEEEQCSDVTRFSDVIKFDVNTHVYYFAHLWDGNPPMAPPNPRYSHNVQELKSRILLAAKQECRGSIMKISDVKFRIQDLWRALLNENFIFSFRNTREVMAMSKLETMYNYWTWELRSHVLTLQDQLINQIQNGKIQTPETHMLKAPVTGKYEAIKKELEKFFNEDPDSEVLVQWKGNFENKLMNLKEKLILDSQSKVQELISFKKNQEKLDNKKSGYEKELLEKSRKLALTVKGTELSEEELHEKFNPLWEKWVCDVSSNLPPVTEPNIEVDSESILLDYFKKEKYMLMDRLKKNSGEKFQIKYDKHIKMNKRYLNIYPLTLEPQDMESINITTDQIISKFSEAINSISRQRHDYHPSYFYEILKIIDEEVKSAPTQERYTVTRKYEIDLSLCLFRSAAMKFKEIHKAFKRANDPVNYLESKKDDFFMSFKISCQGATSIKTFVDFLWHKLTPAISTTVRKTMAPKIGGDMRATCPAFSGNRANLEKHILISLAEEENFDNYWQYLRNSESFFKNYIENCIKRYCSEQRNEKMKTFLKISLDDIKNAILSAIHASTAIAKDKSSTVSEWLDLFCDHLGGNLIFPRKDLVSIEHQEIKDIEFLKEAMSKALDPEMEKAAQKCLCTLVEDIVPEIQKMLSEHLCGCWKQCPLCTAICTNTIPTHEGDHSVPFHRPEALSGRHWHQTDQFNINFCTSMVASDCFLRFEDGRKIPYKNYRQAGGEYAKWSITPDTSTQPYWKWFVSHFRSQLEEKYHSKFIGKGAIPDAWNKITKLEVLDYLKNN
ncbi:interferon-induced very large GTPase 1 [Camelus dromedarius]|uniref:interferon-induced very large GTPase 1 n=1 Tax=Camelus dromedarius TaxID=9838 RepID=UPI00057B9CC6|nr:interferon-induced very large GTPase 1-like [Camelus dromedarius]XP_010986764.1 interferon-induced very large GTPase 1-like [Camelus dromedarius]XP_031315994.1 interferon-induced very large GTPase 1-like [Camelus dromedarius]XP_031315995.1 interferon-induced very large GTPase 1-like [Camelus dromedarius]XP_031315996.1 interferon-induced very large GTPase 1-like [Camelus dromedarius]